MNSFKKIALGLVAAMTLGSIVATPASANTVSLAVTTANSGSGTAAAPYLIDVPSDNVVSDTTTVGGREAITVEATVVAGTPVTFTVSGNAKIVTAVGSTVTSASGVTSLTVTPASTTAVVYVFTTSTSASALTASVTGAATTIYLKGEAGPAFNVSLSVPVSGNIGGTVTATALVTDIFGNPVATAPTFTAINATVTAATQDALVVNKYTSTVTLPAAAGNAAVGVSITAPTPVPTLATAVISASALVSVVDLATALAAEKAARAADATAAAAALAAAVKAEQDKAAAAALAAAAELVKANAEIAKLKADAVTAKAAADKALADAVAAHTAELAKLKADNDSAMKAMKAAFNKLARHWNAKNPKAKVTLLK